MKNPNDENYEITEKTLVFSPSGFIVKLLFAIAMTVFAGNGMAAGMEEQGGIMYVIFSYAMLFVMAWFIGSVFGFCLRATGNYIIAVILMVVLIAALGGGMSWLSAKGEVYSAVGGIALIVLLIWLPINDIRKAVLYFKNTV